MNGRFKKAAIWFISVIEILILAFFTYIFSGHIKAHWLSAAIGILPVAIAVIFHMLGKKNRIFYAVSILLNICSSAIFTGMYYTNADKTPSIKELLVASVGALIILNLSYAFLHILPKYSVYTGLCGIMLCIGLAIYNIVMWISVGGVCYSFGFFSLVIAFMCLFAIICINETPTAKALRYASFAGFGVAIIVAVVVLFILSEGEGLEGAFDGIDFGGGGGKKKKSQ